MNGFRCTNYPHADVNKIVYNSSYPCGKVTEMPESTAELIVENRLENNEHRLT